jgi:hypothetical protein
MMVRSQLLALNAVLSEIYGVPTRIGGVLTALGFDEQQTNTLRDVHLQVVLSTVITVIEECLSARDKEDRLYTVLCRRFGLDGAPSETLQSIGSRLGIGRERVRQLQRKAIRLLRSKSVLRFLEEEVFQAAAQLVGTPAYRATADASARRFVVNKPEQSSGRMDKDLPDSRYTRRMPQTHVWRTFLRFDGCIHERTSPGAILKISASPLGYSMAVTYSASLHIFGGDRQLLLVG